LPKTGLQKLKKDNSLSLDYFGWHITGHDLVSQ